MATTSSALTDTWVLRWNSDDEATPELLLPPTSGSPMDTTFAAESGTFAVLDGHLSDCSQLEVGSPAPAAGLVLTAYERWGAALFEKLRGAFTLAIWDRQRRRLLIGRDAMGLSPCFYWWDGREVIVSPSLDKVLAQPQVDGRFNRAVVAEYVQNACSSHQISETFYEDVRRLPPAHAISVSTRRLIVSRYWDPVPPGFSWASDDQLQLFQPTLDRAVSRCLAAGADSIALSGGFDSVSLAILAAEQREGRKPLDAVSLRFANTVCDEADTQIEVARTLGMPQILQTIEESLDGDNAVHAALAESGMSSSPVLSPWQAIYTGLLRSARRRGLARLLMGTGGDDILTVDFSYGRDLLRACEVRGLWRFYQAWRRSSPFSAARVARVLFWDEAIVPEGKRLAKAFLSRVMPRGYDWARARRQRMQRPWSSPDQDLAGVLEARHRALAPIPSLPGEGSYVRTLRYLTQAPLLLLELDQAYNWARRQGITLLLPYFDQDLVERSLRTHPDILIAGGRAKAQLRRLVGERLPSVTLPSKKVDFTQMVHAALRPAGRDAWRNLGGPTKLAELGIVEPRRVEPFTEDYFTGRHDNWVRTWLILSTEVWLRARAREACNPTERRTRQWMSPGAHPRIHQTPNGSGSDP